MIDRPGYLEKLLRWKDRDVIKVVTGVRRCGKSTLLTLFMSELERLGVPPERIISINFERLEYEHLLDYHALHDEVVGRAQPGSMNYVLLDEVQNVPEFQRVIDSLYVRDNIDLYVTGSNALLLGGTLATLLSGRYVEINMLPLSFGEYRTALGGSVSPSRAYRRYIERGSFPATMDFSDDALTLHDYLNGILNTVLLKDVAQRLNISNNLGLRALVTYLFDNIGNLTSAKRISDAIASTGTKISANTVMEYLSALCGSFIFYPASRYDVRGRRVLKLQQKYCTRSAGFWVCGGRRCQGTCAIRDAFWKTSSILSFAAGSGRCTSAGPGIWRSTSWQSARKGRSTSRLPNRRSRSRALGRELAPLRAVRDNRPKTLITMDDADPGDHDGIRRVFALEWLEETYR